jgi:hypothetical protein
MKISEEELDAMNWIRRKEEVEGDPYVRNPVDEGLI